MANFGIIRIQKLKTATSVRASLKHALREQETPNADIEKLTDNRILTSADSVQSAIKNYNSRLDTQEKIRKNAVTCVEFLVTASPEAMQQKTPEEQKAYFDDAMKWIEEKHGKENVIFAAVHNDETTPHLTAFVVPIDNRGKLCCKSFYGGSKHVLSELQTEFTDKVAQHHDLERGVRGSKAKHVSIKDYYARVNAPIQDFPKLQAIDVERRGSLLKRDKESNEELASRLNNAIQGALNRRGLLEKANELDSVRNENETLKNTLKSYQSTDKLSKARDVLPKQAVEHLDKVFNALTNKAVMDYKEQLDQQQNKIKMPSHLENLSKDRER